MNGRRREEPGAAKGRIRYSSLTGPGRPPCFQIAGHKGGYVVVSGRARWPGRYLRLQLFQIPLLLMAVKLRRFGQNLFVVQLVLIAEMTDGAHGFNLPELDGCRYIPLSSCPQLY